MDEAHTPTLDPAIFDRNLAALARTDPALAGQLRETGQVEPGGSPSAGRPSATVAATRDGGLSFRITRPEGAVHWLGRTSIPSVRSAALLERFDAGQANVLLPGMGEGSEARLLTERLGPHRAVFVCEHDLLALALALRLHDAADAIAPERLVFLVCPLPDLTSTFVAWLERHPGHLCPERIMMWPWQSAADVAPYRTAVESAWQQIEPKRQQAIAEIRARRPALSIPATADETPSRRPTVALLALHAHHETWALADALAAGASSSGCRPILVDVRGPGDMHALGRLKRLHKAGSAIPDLAILIDVVREQVQDVLPDEVPAVAWLSHRAGVSQQLISRAVHDPIVVTDSRLACQVRACGLDDRRLTVCPLPCLASLQNETLDDRSDRPLDVVVFTDVAPVDPASFGPQLPTYAELWRVATDLLNGRIETFTEDQAEMILARAEMKAGIRIDEPHGRQDILDALNTRVAPALLWRFLMQVLLDNRVSVRIHGEGWREPLGPIAGAPARTVAERTEIMRHARIVVYADIAGQVTAVPLLAAGSGAALVARTHPGDGRPGGLRTLLDPGREMLSFSHARDLVAGVRRLLADEGQRRQLAGQAYRRCRASHAPAHRFAALRAAATS